MQARTQGHRQTRLWRQCFKPKLYQFAYLMIFSFQFPARGLLDLLESTSLVRQLGLGFDLHCVTRKNVGKKNSDVEIIVQGHGMQLSDVLCKLNWDEN